MVTLGASSREPVLRKVAGLEERLPRDNDLDLRVRLLDIFLVLEYNFCVSGSVKLPRRGTNLRQLILVPLVGLWKPHGRASICDAVATMNHILNDQRQHKCQHEISSRHQTR